MIRKFKNYIVAGIMSLFIAAPVLVAAPVATGVASAACSGVANKIALAAGSATSSTISCSSATSLTNAKNVASNLGKTIVNIFSVIIGVASILMILYGGFRYITSGGASDKVGNAKNTIIYAIIGLVIVAIAQIIVHFVLSTANSAATPLGG